MNYAILKEWTPCVLRWRVSQQCSPDRFFHNKWMWQGRFRCVLWKHIEPNLAHFNNKQFCQESGQCQQHQPHCSLDSTQQSASKMELASVVDNRHPWTIVFLQSIVSFSDFVAKGLERISSLHRRNLVVQLVQGSPCCLKWDVQECQLISAFRSSLLLGRLITGLQAH